MNDDHDPQFLRRRFNDAALVLPFAGAFLLMPPFIRIFVTGFNIAGIPMVVIYLFAVWFALIAIAWRLSGPLRETMQAEPPGAGETETPEA